jgi:transcription elongation GreA/GreB family factor
MITKLGKEKLKQDLETLQNELKDVMVERGKAGREGDLKENSAIYFLAKKRR